MSYIVCRSHNSSEQALQISSANSTSTQDESIRSTVPLDEALQNDDKIDYLTAKRQARQLTEKLGDIDKRLRALQTAALPNALSKTELALLLKSCNK